MLVAGLEFFFAEQMLDFDPANARSYRIPVLAILWVTKVAELGTALLAVIGLFLISRPAKGDHIEKGALHLRKLLALAFWLAPGVALGHLVSFFGVVQVVLEMGCYIREAAAGVGMLTIPPMLLGYVAAVTNRSGQRRLAVLCVGVCIAVSLLHLLLLYAYVRECIWAGAPPPPIYFSTLTWWAHNVSGLPLPGLTAYYWLGWQNAGFLWPLGVYAVALIALLRTRTVLHDVVKRRINQTVLARSS